MTLDMIAIYGFSARNLLLGAQPAGLNYDSNRQHDNACRDPCLLLSQPYLITAFVLFACFSTNIDVALFVNGVFYSSDYPPVYVFQPWPGPGRVGYEGFYCIRTIQTLLYSILYILKGCYFNFTYPI